MRRKVDSWRDGGWREITPVTRDLLEYWTADDREKRLFFCQLEAAETAIYVGEAAGRLNDAWTVNRLAEANARFNSGLPRVAFKMATGTGKTVVMAMLIAWQALNKLAAPRDPRFSDAFLLVAPGITIKDRLRVLNPNDPLNYYLKMDILKPELWERLLRAHVEIVNYHAFIPRERGAGSRLAKLILSEGGSAFTETADDVANRVCRGLSGKRGVIVINDEAHHCYRGGPEADSPASAGGRAGKGRRPGGEEDDDEGRGAGARVWMSGLDTIRAKFGLKAIYDLSATPFFLKGSGHPEGTLFPWVVSDFALIDAIESGLVKIPRVPVADNALAGGRPVYRDLWPRICGQLPRAGRKTPGAGGEPRLPPELQAALLSLYGNYEKLYRRWEKDHEARAGGVAHPVFIVVCGNQNVSELLYRFIGGWEGRLDGGGSAVQAGGLEIFRNDDGRGGWARSKSTILVDSARLESPEPLTPEFRRMAARQIEELRSGFLSRFPGRRAEKATDEDILRETLNTVAQPGRLGEDVKCVVSVSMLTEGWDAKTVTHVLGVRAFSTQLLCEQVVGRALRRLGYCPGETGLLEPQYAEVYGVPFSFLPCGGSAPDPKPGPVLTRVRALEERERLEITFPRLVGYRHDQRDLRLSASFGDQARLILSTGGVPTEVDIEPVVGRPERHTLDALKRRRPNEVAFLLAKRVLDTYFTDDGGGARPWLFPDLLGIAKRWMDERLVCHDGAFKQMLLLTGYMEEAAARLYGAIVAASPGEPRLVPILSPHDATGSTRSVNFETSRRTYPTSAQKSHVSHVVIDSGWELSLARKLEDAFLMPSVARYVKNQNLGLSIPYVLDGQDRSYLPDFIVCLDDGRGPGDPLHLIVEVSGARRRDKDEKVRTAQTFWVPAVNNHGGFGRWAFKEITDPLGAAEAINDCVQEIANGRQDHPAA
jgi:type III restriction enzyme